MSIRRKLTQEITYWAPAGSDKYGNETFDSPVKIIGRWEERSEQVMLPNGEITVSKAIVFVDQDLEIEGYLVEGDHTAQNDPTLTSASIIRNWVEIPSMRSNETERRAIL